MDDGCMMVVPREFDPNYDHDHTARHMLVPDPYYSNQTDVVHPYDSN